MPEPLGEKIFDAGALQDNGFYRDGDLEEGICASASCHWIARTIQNGVLKNVGMIGSAHKITLTQAAYEFGSLSKGNTNAEDEASLAEACGLTVVSRKVAAAPTSPEARREIAILDLEANRQTSGPVYFWLGLKRQGGGHAIGIQMWCLAHVYLFDANVGLYRYKPNEWAKGFEHLLTKCYPGANGSTKYSQPSVVRKLTPG
jgi:hypothetical protein